MGSAMTMAFHHPDLDILDQGDEGMDERHRVRGQSRFNGAGLGAKLLLCAGRRGRLASPKGRHAKNS